jgi:hypothetical protein
MDEHLIVAWCVFLLFETLAEGDAVDILRDVLPARRLSWHDGDEL